MNTWAPIWSGIVNSSIWDEEDYVVKVFLTMLAVKDADHVVRFSAYQLGRLSRKTEKEVMSALDILSKPDKLRLEPQEYDGRRIERVSEGWMVLNGGKYKSLVQEEMRRTKQRKAQANWRAKQAGKPLPYPNSRNTKTVIRQPTPGEQAAIDAQHEKTSTEVKKLNAMQKSLQHDVEIDPAQCEQADAEAKGEL